MDLESAARELYALLPGEFTAARNAKAKAAAQDGNKELARQIKELPKPPAAAWLVNMLALHHPDRIDDLVRLGQALGEAQEQLDPQRLQQLGRQRRELLAALAEQGRELAEELGNPVGAAAATDVEQTLHAAMADPAAAAAVASGLLTGPLSSNGLDPVDLGGKVAVPGAVEAVPAAGRLPGRRQPPAGGPPGRGARRAEQHARREPVEAGRRRRAEAEVDRAGERLEDAEEKQQRIRDRLDELTDRREELEDQIAGLKHRLAGLEREVSGVEQQEAAAGKDFEAAAKATARAKEALRQARKQLEALS
ncbi:hypothetical protein [Arthrobacter mobilis]|uniref:Uncharacterized protein n=1 Tax=Arthrobacter mobilis TaxID=2724944 RepID=A0A7X6K625_9MICC|nr:hypothetical protein [Arthrobacter mobilis]NKX54263.1 hypothetical protein [Arthrobacter mobilis]